MPSPYQVELSNEEKVVTVGELAFVDPDNQPADVNQPFRPAAGETVTVVEDAAGDPVLVYDDDAGEFDVTGRIHATGQIVSDLQVTGDGLDAGAGLVAGAGLGGSIPIVTVTDAAPTVYVTPLVFDTTAVTGGLYAWDGAAYQQAGGPL